MNKKVCVKITGLHGLESQEPDEKIEVINIGTYYKRNGKHYIRYEEPIERSDKVNNNLLKISLDEVELIAKGDATTHMVFTKGEKNMTYYNTPFGGMNMSIDTYQLNVTESDVLISADIRYGLEINLDYITECKVHIDVESLQS